MVSPRIDLVKCCAGATLAIALGVVAARAELQYLGHAMPPPVAAIGQLIDIAVDGNVAYTADVGGFVPLFDISDPSAPSVLDPSPRDLVHLGHALTLHGDYLFLAGDATGLALIDRSEVTDGAAPYPLSVLATAPQGTYATTVSSRVFSLPTGPAEYIATGYSYDGSVVISQFIAPSGLTEVARYRCPWRHLVDIEVVGDLLFATSFDGNPGYLDIVDLTSDAGVFMPRLVGRVAFDMTQYGIVGQMSVHGNRLFLATSTHPGLPTTVRGGFVAVDITDPAAPAIIGGSRQVFDDAKHIRFRNAGIACDGTNLVLIGGTSVALYSVANPAAPVLVGAAEIPVDLRPSTSAGVLSPALGGNAVIAGNKVFVCVHGNGEATGRIGGGIVIYTTATMPRAHAGADQTVGLNATVVLDGTLSGDPEGDPISYAWRIVSQPGSAVLSNPASPHPSMVVAVPGDYTVELVVTDNQGNVSLPDRVVISTINTPPTIDLGADQALTVLYQPVSIYNGSYDLDGDALSYEWSVVLEGEGPVALDNASAVSPTFVPAAAGTYMVTLAATDTWGARSEGTVLYAFANVKPVATAGDPRSGLVNHQFTLDGSGSYDGNGDQLSYRWAVVSRPEGSTSAIADATAAVTSFVPDTPGLYVLGLVVNDGTVDSDQSNTTITAIALEDAATQRLQDAMTVVCGSAPPLDVTSFRNRNMPNALCNKLNSVIANIASGDIESARGQLLSDIIGKTDGCAIEGAPDRNDWVLDCAAQEVLYPILSEAATLLGAVTP